MVPYEPVGREIVCLFHRPALSCVLQLDEYASPLPLDIDKCIYDRAVVVFKFLLVVECPDCRVPTRGIVFRIVPSICSDLHLHDVLGDVELEVPFGIDRNCRYRDHVLVGRHLEQHAVVEVQGSQGQVFVKRGAENAHRRGVLAYNSGRIEVDVVAQEGVAHIGPDLPAWDGESGLNLRSRDLTEIIVPSVVVREIVLVVELWLLQAGLEMYSQGNRALPRPSERIEGEVGIGLDAHVVLLLSEEYIFTLGIPLDVLLELAFHSCIDEGGIPDGVRIDLEIGWVEGIVVEDAVADPSVQLGHYGLFRPWLEPDEQPVLQLADTQGIIGLVRIVEEVPVIELPPYVVGARKLVGVELGEH